MKSRMLLISAFLVCDAFSVDAVAAQRGPVSRPAQGPPGQECQTMPTQVNGQWSEHVSCRGQDGIWRQLDADGRLPEGDAFPVGFNGIARYSGRYEGSQTTPGRPMNRLNLRNLARAVGSNQDYAGDYSVQIRIEGDRVSGQYSGSGGIATTNFKGTRIGTRCRLVNDRTGAMIDAECTASRFTGTVRSGPSERRSYEVSFNANRVHLATGRSMLEPVPTREATSLSQCGPSAPRTQAQVDAMSTYDLLVRGQAMHRNWACSSLYFGAAALRGDAQGMAAYAYGFSADSPRPEPTMETYWCQRAYRTARANRDNDELDAVNYFCPIETIASLMTPEERRRNQVSVVRSQQTSEAIRAQAEAQVRAIMEFALSNVSGQRPAGYHKQAENDLEASRLQRESFDRQSGKEPQ